MKADGYVFGQERNRRDLQGETWRKRLFHANTGKIEGGEGDRYRGRDLENREGVR